MLDERRGGVSLPEEGPGKWLGEVIDKRTRGEVLTPSVIVWKRRLGGGPL